MARFGVALLSRQQSNRVCNNGLRSSLRRAAAEITDGTGDLSGTNTACGCANWLTSAVPASRLFQKRRGEQRGEALDLVLNARRESGGLAGGADGGVASGKFFFREADELFSLQFRKRDALSQSKEMIAGSTA